MECTTMDCSDCKNQLDLGKLCAKKAKIDCLCAVNLMATTINVENEVVNNICVSQGLKASKVEALSVNSNDLCSQRAVINSLCVNELTVGVLNSCQKYRAAVTFSADSNYNLGDPIDWNTVLDDPNGNVGVGPFKYTVPASGYYVVTFHLESSQLNGAATITGIPVGLLNVLVNGNPLRQLQSPFLSFSNNQNANLTSLSLLNAGDIVTMTYDTLVYDQVSGLIKYVGTINIKANGAFPGTSGFAIHYLSSLNCSTVICQPCPPVQIPCTPIKVDCHTREGACTPQMPGYPTQCKPCGPCG